MRTKKGKQLKPFTWFSHCIHYKWLKFNWTTYIQRFEGLCKYVL